MDRILETAAACGAIVCVFGHWDMLDPAAALARRHGDVPFVLDTYGECGFCAQAGESFCKPPA